MKLLRLVLIPLTLTTGLFGEGILGQDAIRSLEELEAPKKTTMSDGMLFIIEDMNDLPTQVKPGAVIKIKKSVIDPQDPDRIVLVQSITNAQEEKSSLAGKDEIDKDGVYHIIQIPSTPKKLEFEVLFNMQAQYPKYEIYKYSIRAHTFQIEQPGENWSFGTP